MKWLKRICNRLFRPPDCKVCRDRGYVTLWESFNRDPIWYNAPCIDCKKGKRMLLDTREVVS